jgi:hypothetical protein
VGNKAGSASRELVLLLSSGMLLLVVGMVLDG